MTIKRDKKPMSVADRQSLISTRISASLLVAGLILSGLAHATVPTSPASYTRTTTYATDPVTGDPLSSVQEPDLADECVQDSYQHADAYGNRTNEAHANCASAPAAAQFVTRSATVGYGSTASVTINGVSVPAVGGAFAYTTTNALSQITRRSYDPRFGAVLTQTGPDGLTSTSVVDDLGRPVQRTAADGTYLLIKYCTLAAKGIDASADTPGCPATASGENPADAINFIYSEPHGKSGAKSGPFTRSFYDRKGRVLRTTTEAFDGAAQPGGTARLLVTDTGYNGVGVAVLKTEPRFFDSNSSTASGKQ